MMIMEDVHKTHPGRQARETVLRTIAWWPGMSQDVEQLVSRCENCQKTDHCSEKQSRSGQKQTYGNKSTWPGPP